MKNQKPPKILVQTWLQIYNNQKFVIDVDHQAQSVVKRNILNCFESVYEAEMFLFNSDKKR